MPAVVRPIGPDELDLFTSFTDASPLGLKPPPAMYLDGLGGWYRPEWSWVALRDGRVVARVAFGGPPEARLPVAMGSLELGTRPDRVETGVALVRAAVADRRTVARRAGLRFLVERVLVRWTAGPALAPRPGRLTFRPVGDDAEVLAVVRGTLEGTPDAHARRDLARLGVEGAARVIVGELPGPRSLVRLASDPAGRPVGITVPASGPGGPTTPTSACSPSTGAGDTWTTCCWRRPTCSSRPEPPRSTPPPTSATPRWRRRSRAAGTR